ncbi:MAG TPA: hypothetical protein VEX68_14695 [Bryobacteraceae bacterium]|nr:hypothetical protein [Bryobacteraceae bacterium]
MMTFYLVGVVLAIDMATVLKAHLIHSPDEKSHVKRWATINVLVGMPAVIIMLYPLEHKPLALMLLAVLRSGFDYAFC